MSTDAALIADSTPTTGNRRGALAALVAGSALGLAALGGAPPAEAAKGKNKKGKKGKNSTKGRTTVGAALPSVRYAYKTTVFDTEGVATATSPCPAGYVPLNGGFSSSLTAPVLLTSTPRLDLNAWLIEVNGAQMGHQITVVAVCLAASDDTTVEDTEHRSARHKRRKQARRK